MRTIIIIFFLLTHFSTFAQQINISGTVKDRTTQQGLPFVTVALLDTDNKIISGITTNDIGLFKLTFKTIDKVQLKIQSIGYISLDTVLVIDKYDTDQNFSFYLTPSITSLQEVTVSAEKNATSSKIDKQTFNVKQIGNTTSGTGLDILQRLPSVTINTEGKILMRGNAEFLVTINGKFTNQTAADVLGQLPANTIENIEIISSPSASLDAEGKAGIINIITKKVNLDGWGIITNANLSNVNPARYGGDFTFYKSKNKFSSFITANFRQYNIGGFRKGEIRTLFQDTITYSPSNGERPTKEKIYGIRAGTTFAPNQNTTFNAGIYYGYKQNDRTANLHYREYSTTQQPLNLNYDFAREIPDRMFLNENIFVRTGKFFTANTEYIRNFKNKNKLSIATIYEYSVLGGPLTNQDTDEATKKLTLRERSNEISPLNAWRVQADYSIFISSTISLETGLQWRTVQHNGDFEFERLNILNNNWEKDPEFNDNLNLTQSIYAGYLQANGKYKNFDYRIGLRAEQMYRNLTHTLGKTPANLEQLDFFPTLQTFLKLKNEQSLKLGYSKRIDRPTTKALAPFKNHRHSEAIWIGDPNLLPEISHNIELGYIKNFNKLSLTLTSYYNTTNNLIFRVNDSYSRITLFTIATNAGNSQSTGLEFTSDWQISDKIRLYASGNMYRFQLYNLKNSDVNNRQSTNYNLNGNFSYRFLPKLKWEWNTTYLSKSVTAQGYDTDLLLSNMSVKYSHSKKFTFDLIFQNMFNSNVQTINTQNNSFISSTQYGKYDRIVQLNINYKFNDNNKNIKTLKTEYGEKDF